MPGWKHDCSPVANLGKRTSKHSSKPDHAVTASDLAIAASWSYGLAAAGYTAFTIRLAFGWRRSARATLLIAATTATALWSASTVAQLLWSVPFGWVTANVFDALRYAAWFTFAAYLLKGRATDEKVGAVAAPAIAWWAAAFVAAALVASLVLSTGYLFQSWQGFTRTIGQNPISAGSDFIAFDGFVARAVFNY